MLQNRGAHPNSNRLGTIGIYATLAILVLCSLFSCATGPHTFSTDPLGYLGEDAAWYGVVPVAENRPILEALSKRMEDGDSFMKNIDRATMLYLTETSGKPDENGAVFPFRLVVTGSFPPRMASVAFSLKNGWVKVVSKDGVWYQNGTIAAAIPRPGLLFLGSPADLPEMLKNIPYSGEVPVRAEFRDLVPRSGTGDGTLAVYVRDGALVENRLLEDSPFSLPITDLLVTVETATKIVETPYAITIRFFLPDQRTTRALAPLVRLIFTSSVQTQGNSLFFTLPVDGEDIADFLDFLYF